MARVKELSNAELAPQMRALMNPENEPLVRVYGHAPELYGPWLALATVLYAEGRLGAKLKELVRLKSASINGCRH